MEGENCQKKLSYRTDSLLDGATDVNLECCDIYDDLSEYDKSFIIKHLFVRKVGTSFRTVHDRVRNHDKNLVVRSCTISCTTKLAVVHDKNRARQKSCTTKIVHNLGFGLNKF